MAEAVPKTSQQWLDALNEKPEGELHDLSDSNGILKPQVPLDELTKDKDDGAPAQPKPPQPEFMKPSDYTNTPMEQVTKPKGSFLPGVTPTRSEQKRQNEADEVRKREPLPQIPGANGVMTVEEAYDFLGCTAAERGDLDKVKTRFRKMCLKWHPDKNRGREREAAEVFQAANAAYHFLTTTNFDFKKWKEAFTIPPMQSLDEVLLLALSGADPDQVEQLLRRRGEYRPHRDFGVNLSIPWNAGYADDPSYDVASGSAYTTTKKLESASASDGGELGAIGTSSGADDEAYALALDDLVQRGADLGKLRRMASTDASSAELKNELKRVGYYKLGERSRAISALKAAAAGRVAASPDQWDSSSSSKALVDQPGGSGEVGRGQGGGTAAETRLAGLATEEALLGELAIVEAPRVRELGLYDEHSKAYLERFGRQAELGANDDERPWEATALGREVVRPYKAPYVRARTYPSIAPFAPNAHEFAEKANEQALEGYRSKNYQLCYDAASEAIRLNPQKVPYLANRAAAALKLRGQAHLRQAIDDCKMAMALEPNHVKSYLRSAEAHYLMGEPQTVLMAIELYEKALRLEPGNQAIESALERVRMIFQSDYA